MYYERKTVTPEKLEADLKALEGFQAKAEELKAKTIELRKVLAEEFMAFADENLRDYDYHREINDAVSNFTYTSGLDFYEPEVNFWLPSNIGC